MLFELLVGKRLGAPFETASWAGVPRPSLTTSCGPRLPMSARIVLFVLA